ncbi:MAG: 16S rRNA (guanine(527)-N(7))-methyltransferase RsmG [Lachnospiraceae bacterium]|nr:16S rRNA (guanine(527)-N(7))-methyltransferase RsmG [Lachnospiraceae bacterium]
MNENRKEELINVFADRGFHISDEQALSLIFYYEAVCERNKEMNLTAITEWEEFLHKHILDSISLGLFINDLNSVPYSLIDVGTGAGFPGIPLKIVYPSMKVTLLDSLKKRTDFLNEVIGQMKLKDIIAIHGRAEDFGKDPSYREKYDFAVSRAVAKMDILSEICIPFIKAGGIFAAYKTADCKDELEDAKEIIEILGGKTNSTDHCSYEIEGFDIEREIFFIKKEKLTPGRYPRRPGKTGRKS